jgi:hypothetical protein
LVARGKVEGDSGRWPPRAAMVVVVVDVVGAEVVGATVYGTLR